MLMDGYETNDECKREVIILESFNEKLLEEHFLKIVKYTNERVYEFGTWKYVNFGVCYWV